MAYSYEDDDDDVMTYEPPEDQGIEQEQEGFEPDTSEEDDDKEPVVKAEEEPAAEEPVLKWDVPESTDEGGTEKGGQSHEGAVPGMVVANTEPAKAVKYEPIKTEETKQIEEWVKEKPSVKPSEAGNMKVPEKRVKAPEILETPKDTTPKGSGYVPTNLLRMEGQPASNGGMNYSWNGQIRNVANDNGQIRDTLLYGNQTAGVDPAKAAAQEAARKQFENTMGYDPRSADNNLVSAKNAAREQLEKNLAQEAARKQFENTFGYDPETADNNLVSAENFAREQLEQKLAQQQAQQEALKKQEEFLANWNPNPDVMAAVADQGQAFRDEYNRRAEADRKQAEFLANWNPDQATLQYLGSQGEAIKQTLEEREKRDQRNAAFDEARAQSELPDPQVIDRNVEKRNEEFDAERKAQKNLPDPQVIDKNKPGGINDKLDDIMGGAHSSGGGSAAGGTSGSGTGSTEQGGTEKGGQSHEGAVPGKGKVPDGSTYFRPSYGQDMEKGVKAPYRKGGYTAEELEGMGNKARSDWKYYNGNKAYEGYYLAPDGHYYPVDQIKANYYRQNGSYSGWQEGMRDYWNTFGTFYGYRPNWQQTGRGGGGGGSRGGGGGSRGYSYSGGGGNGSGNSSGYYWNGNTSWSI